MNRIQHQKYISQQANFWKKPIAALGLTTIFLMLIGCGGGNGPTEETTSDNHNAGDTNVAENYLFFMDQVYQRPSCLGDCDLPPNQYDIYRVASAAGHSISKLNSAPVSHLFSSYEFEELAGDQHRLITGMVWLENGRIYSANSKDPTVITVASQGTNQIFCSVRMFGQNMLEEAGFDRSCENDEDNILYSFELIANSPLTPATNVSAEHCWGYSFLQLDENGVSTAYAFRYVDDLGKTIVFNYQTCEVVAEYSFEIPYQNRFKVNGWLFVLEEDRLARISLNELKNGTFDLESSYIPLSEYIAYNSRVLESLEDRFYGLSQTDLINALPNEPVRILGVNEIRSLNLMTGELSAPVTFNASFYYPDLNLLETPGLAHVRDSDNHYFVDLNTGQADLVFEAPPSGSSRRSYHGDLVLFSNEDSRGAGTGAYVLSLSGLRHSYPNATWDSFFYDELDYERYTAILTSTAPENGHTASIQIIDKKDFSVVRNLGSYTSPYHNIRTGFRLGYYPGRYQLVTDTYNSNVFFVDLLTENSLTYLMTAHGDIRLW